MCVHFVCVCVCVWKRELRRERFPVCQEATSRRLRWKSGGADEMAYRSDERRIPSERMTELNNLESDAMEEGKRDTERAIKREEGNRWWPGVQ